MSHRDPDESLDEYLSRVDPDAEDMAYESWRDRQAELAEGAGPWPYLRTDRDRYVNREDEP